MLHEHDSTFRQVDMYAYGKLITLCYTLKAGMNSFEVSQRDG